MNEDEVTKKVVDSLTAEFRNHNVEIKSGEIHLGNRHLADVVVFRFGEPIFAVECKGTHGNIKKGIGQACVYRSIAYCESAVAGHNISSELRNAIRTAGLYCIDVDKTLKLNTPTDDKIIENKEKRNLYREKRKLRQRERILQERCEDYKQRLEECLELSDSVEGIVK